MKKILLIPLFIILLLIVHIPKSNFHLTLDPPQTVPYVNLARYVGIWFEQASIPTVVIGCEKTIADYSFNPNGTIRVNNTCQRNGVRGGVIGYAYPNPQDIQNTNSKLLVQFPQNPSPGDYWIVRLDEDYTYAVVSNPDYSQLWILYRKPNMPDELFQMIYKDLQSDGFSVQKLQKTLQ